MLSASAAFTSWATAFWATSFANAASSAVIATSIPSLTFQETQKLLVSSSWFTHRTDHPVAAVTTAWSPLFHILWHPCHLTALIGKQLDFATMSSSIAWR